MAKTEAPAVRRVSPAPPESDEESSPLSSLQSLSCSDASWKASHNPTPVPPPNPPPKPSSKSISAWQSNNAPLRQAATRAVPLLPPSSPCTIPQFTNVVLHSESSPEMGTCSGLDIIDVETNESQVTEGLGDPSQDHAPALPAPQPPTQRHAVGPDGKVFFDLGHLSVRTLRQLGTITGSLIVPPVLATIYSMGLVYRPHVISTTLLVFHMIDHVIFGMAIIGFILGIQSICFHRIYLFPAGMWLVVWIIINVLFEVVVLTTDMPLVLRQRVHAIAGGMVVLSMSITIFVISWRHLKKHHGVAPSRVLPSGEAAPEQEARCLFCRLSRVLRSVILMFVMGSLVYAYEWSSLALIFYFKGQLLQVIPVAGRGLITLVFERLYHTIGLWSPSSYYWMYAYYLASRFIFGAMTIVVIQDYHIFLLSEALVLASLGWLLFKLWLSIGASAPGWLKRLIGTRMDLSPEHLVSIMSLNVFSQLQSAIFICLQHLALPKLPPETSIFFYASLLRAVVVVLTMHWIARCATGFSCIQGYCYALLCEPVYLTAMVLFIEIQALKLLQTVPWVKAFWSAQGQLNFGDAI